MFRLLFSLVILWTLALGLAGPSGGASIPT
jgi:hypothetical protein